MENLCIIPPPLHTHTFFKNSWTSILLHCRKRSSSYVFGSEFRQIRTIVSDISDGIRTDSAMRAQLVISPMGSCCCTKNQVWKTTENVIVKNTDYIPFLFIFAGIAIRYHDLSFYLCGGFTTANNTISDFYIRSRGFQRALPFAVIFLFLGF